ncbi:Aldehyde/histidinol dehydrogenase [Entophlyctis helioformis]|nr:Aldehyde/histidinol dehydrogenase [Entophlyctis helioformis]
MSSNTVTPSAELVQLAQAARRAAIALQSASSTLKNTALQHIHDSLAASKPAILAANRADLLNAEKQVQAGSLSSALFKRLDLAGPADAKFDSLLSGVLRCKLSLASRLDTGLDLFRVSCPVGVLLVIFEARPEVVVQVACLALKSGNAVILKGGKEAAASNAALHAAIQTALAGVPGADGLADAVQLVSTRGDVDGLLALDGLIDLVIPRGSNELVRHVQGSTRIPVLGHADGICSVYVDKDADVRKAVDVVVDSKVNYPAACNAAETLIVHADVLGTHLPPIAAGLLARGVTLRCDAESLAALSQSHAAAIASGAIMLSTPADYTTEFLDLVMAVKTVPSLAAAITHINSHGSKHTDCILTETETSARTFMTLVDAAGVYWNASTRFADGFRYGFGAEIGVSTNKTHARGPVGLEGLVIYKYRLYGSGHTVAPYNSGEKVYHRAEIPLGEAQTML